MWGSLCLCGVLPVDRDGGCPLSTLEARLLQPLDSKATSRAVATWVAQPGRNYFLASKEEMVEVVAGASPIPLILPLHSQTSAKG